ncbi:tRNA uridine-5-carboxymethylaminomethyl(34) synthesis enzyme MnmG [Candidatus Uabimicrobium sp. HlEnr_7]|uniref:tRNA uridine-5-carboxymethylaminomethyl(34) synthesis enzyme MnmG n=1 Tax=Candidatus Uabimicrobium helgolandensis TaxID=3095367 RepID=UPI003556BE86
MLEEHYDIIVVGAGHAGCEAALSSARIGAKTLLVTMDIDRIAQMSCNPAVGGLGKGHLVREIDALGGEMGKAIDATGIHFKMLGQSRGPAVHGPRAQADKQAYQRYMKQVVESTPNLTVRQDRIEGILVKNDQIKGLKSLTGTCYYSSVVILTTGTFLNGKIHMGLNNYSGGRASEPGTGGCSNSLKDFGFEIGRLKTGTPPRVNTHTINYDVCEVQLPDENPHFFSFSTKERQFKQVPCYITWTNPNTHEIIHNALDRSPIYSGAIQSVGPRYCPSIEDKIVRFAGRERHQVFLEPEGMHTSEVYCNGISTSLPPDVQMQYVRSIAGLEQAEIMRFGYAVEYDFVNPTQIFPSLETKKIEGLFLAGQINGTTGYEEAAAQGLMAGINAARKVAGKDPIILMRDQAYIGVLIDDLVTRGTKEPYRMFTSRAEYRLILRQDNANRRLMPVGREIGLITNHQYQELMAYEEQISQLHKTVAGLRHENKPLKKVLRRPEINIHDMCHEKNELQEWLNAPQVLQQVEIEVKYEGYIERQEIQINKFQKMENAHLSTDIDYFAIPTLSREAQEKLAKHTPSSIGQASRISGVTPADISVLLIYISGNKLPCKNT